MMRRTRIALLGACTVWLAAPAGAADQPIGAVKLTLRRSASGTEKLVFVSKDAAFLFPPLGSADDPGTGSPGGALLEVASLTDPAGAAIAVPSGLGNPGWRSRDAKADGHKYANSDAPLGPSLVRAITLRQGKIIKVVARDTGLALTGPQRAVGIRLVTGSLRNCALFDAPTIKHDEADRFVAKGAVASALADCAVLVPGAPLVFGPCTGGDGYPACNGTCSSGEQCLQTLDFRNPESAGCSCYPAGVTPCGGSEFPACGGACSGGGATCQAFGFGRGGGCGCVDSQSTCPNATGIGACPFQPGVCPPGGICTFIGNPAIACGCTFP